MLIGLFLIVVITMALILNLVVKDIKRRKQNKLLAQAQNKELHKRVHAENMSLLNGRRGVGSTRDNSTSNNDSNFLLASMYANSDDNCSSSSSRSCSGSSSYSSSYSSSDSSSSDSSSSSSD